MVSICPDEYREIVKALVRARKGAGVTQVQLAAAIGQRQTFISKVEQGERRLDVAEFVRLIRMYEKDPFEAIRSATSAR